MLVKNPSVGGVQPFDMPIQFMDMFALITRGRESMTISLLLVDDDELVLEALTEYLQFVGYIVYPAANGVEALRLASLFPIDLVLSDLRMPGMDGYTLCRELYRLHNLPALLMSGFYEEYEQKDATAGIHDFIRKPFLPDELESRIRTLWAQIATPPKTLLLSMSEFTGS